MKKEAIVQLTKEARGWYLRGYRGPNGWTEEGPFETQKQAIAAADEYASLCGFQAFTLTIDE